MDGQANITGPAASGAPRTSRAAVASLILAILVIVPFAGLAAIVVGIVALSKISGAAGALTGRGKAVAGIVIGVFALVLWCVLAPVGIGLYGYYVATGEVCRTNLHTIGNAVQAYADDNSGEMPANLQALVDGGYADSASFICMREVLHKTFAAAQAGSEGEDIEDMMEMKDVDADGSYYYGRLKENPSGLADASKVPLVWDKKAVHRGEVNVLWADYSVTAADPSALEAALSENADLYTQAPTPPGMPGAADTTGVLQ